MANEKRKENHCVNCSQPRSKEKYNFCALQDIPITTGAVCAKWKAKK